MSNVNRRVHDNRERQEALAEAWAQLRAAEPDLRPRNGAERLGVAEAELVSLSLGQGVRRLQPDWPTLFERLEPVGPVMALTRNDHAVHERHGIYRDARLSTRMGLLNNPDIDLRIFLDHWHHLFAVNEWSSRGARESLQIFDREGIAVHKIYRTEESDGAAWNRLVDTLLDEDQSTPFVPEPATHRRADDNDRVDVDALLDGWDNLTDTHDFAPLLRRLKVGREQALALAGPGRARQVSTEAIRVVMRRAADRGLPVMVFVHNHGTIQIHTGTVRKLVDIHDWFNVIDPAFNLHLRMSGIAGAWMVRKPTDDGPVHSLELYDEDSRLLLQMFGERKRGRREEAQWRAILESLPSVDREAEPHHEPA
ncbi:MAG: hemin-degrading factor [Guyparkeria sp.]